MQNFLSLWLNAGAQITHGGQVQRPRQKSQNTECIFWKNFLLQIQQWGDFLRIMGLRNCVWEHKVTNGRVASICDCETSAFYIDDVFEILSILDV